MGLKKQFVSAILLGSALTAPLFAQDIATPSSSIDTLAIFSFNDFHGAFASDGITPGAARLVQMTQNEKQRYPHSIVVSGGDKRKLFLQDHERRAYQRNVRGDGRGNVRHR